MNKKLLGFIAGFLLINSSLFAQDVSIDGNGNLATGASNSYGNLKVIGASGEYGVVGEASGTGAAGVYGKNTNSNNYGILGNDQYGVYGNSGSGYAGYFQGDVRITGNLSVDGSWTGETDPTVNASVKDGVDWTELTGIPSGFADGIDNTTGSEIWTQGGPDIYYNSGRVGIGTATPAGKLDVNGDICLGSVCRSTWPSGSGTGAFTDTGTTAYYMGGNVGIGTTSPVPLGSTDTKILHLKQAVGLLDNAAAGVRFGVDNLVDGGITSAYNKVSGDAGIFLGALSNHRVGFITNSMEKMSLMSNGYLGIGTTSPAQLLHVQGSAYISGNLGIGIDSPTNSLQIRGSNALLSSNTGDFRLHISKSSAAGTSSLIFQDNFAGYAEVGLSGDNNLHFKVSPNGTSFSDAMIIDNATANVGIGTSGAGAKLKVLKTTPYSFAIYAESIGDNAMALLAEKDGIGHAVQISKHPGETGNALAIEHYGSDAAFVIKNGNPALPTEIFVVDSTGNVGIGTSTPQGKLDVNGPIYQRGGVLHADYVFEPDYKLETIGEHAEFMWQNKHLKAIPKAMIDKNGEEVVEVGSHRKGIVEELEKAHIYIDQLHKQIRDMEENYNERLSALEKRLAIPDK